MYKTIIGFIFFCLKCVINNYWICFFVICKIINVEVRVINLVFDSADNSYLNNDSFAYHKKRIQ